MNPNEPISLNNPMSPNDPMSAATRAPGAGRGAA